MFYRSEPWEKEKNMLNTFVRKLAETEYVRDAITDRADLSVFNERPTPRIIFGLSVIGVSYIIGWPVITALGMLSVYLHEPIILAVGGPVIYLISHLTFIVGAYFAGAKYTRALIRWLTRITMERLMGGVAYSTESAAEGAYAKNRPDQRSR